MITVKHQGAKIQPLKTASLTEQAFEAIRLAIITNEFLPGDPLRELQLARDLAVSQAVVREALVKLERIGLVVRKSNRGSFVTKLSKKELSERLAVRVALEEMAFVAASLNFAAEDAIQLNRISDQIDSESVNERYFECSQLDLEFHNYVWRLTNNEMLAQLLEQVTVPLFAFISLLRRSNLGGITRERQLPHQILIETLVEGDEQAIRKAIRGHIELSYEHFLQSNIDDFQTLARKLA